MIRIAKTVAFGVSAIILSAGAAGAVQPDLGTDAGPHAFATQAGNDLRDIKLQTGRSVSEPADFHRRGFYGDGFGYGFGGFDYD